jgi:hypothetical protein
MKACPFYILSVCTMYDCFEPDFSSAFTYGSHLYMVVLMTLDDLALWSISALSIFSQLTGPFNESTSPFFVRLMLGSPKLTELRLDSLYQRCRLSKISLMTSIWWRQFLSESIFSVFAIYQSLGWFKPRFGLRVIFWRFILFVHHNLLFWAESDLNFWCLIEKFPCWLVLSRRLCFICRWLAWAGSGDWLGCAPKSQIVVHRKYGILFSRWWFCLLWLSGYPYVIFTHQSLFPSSDSWVLEFFMLSTQNILIYRSTL